MRYKYCCTKSLIFLVVLFASTLSTREFHAPSNNEDGQSEDSIIKRKQVEDEPIGSTSFFLVKNWYTSNTSCDNRSFREQRYDIGAISTSEDSKLTKGNINSPLLDHGRRIDQHWAKLYLMTLVVKSIWNFTLCVISSWLEVQEALYISHGIRGKGLYWSELLLNKGLYFVMCEKYANGIFNY